MSLNSNQISTVNKILGTNSFCSAVVRLYTTTGDDWRFTGIIGVATISKKNGFSTISLIDLDNQTELFSEELYYNFNYQTPKPYFHHFEVADCVAGFSFADDSEAINFSNQVNNNKPTKSQPQMNTPPPINTPPPQQNLTPIQQPPKSNSNPQPPSSQDKKNTKKGGGGGFFSKLFGGGSKKEEVVHEISSPTNFRHESHIGWDPVNGFDIKNIPPAWKELFKKAGVKKSDLQDKETAKLVMETIVDNIGGPPENTPPPPTMTGNNPPPPPPPINNTGGGGGDNVPPPPMPPPPPTFDGPPPPKFDGPPPPKPPPPMQTNNNSGGGGGGTNAPMSFAEQLKMKQTSGLKTVEKVENLPQLPEDTGTLANALASALKNRRGAIEDERDSDDNDSGDEWSD